MLQEAEGLLPELEVLDVTALQEGATEIPP